MEIRMVDVSQMGQEELRELLSIFRPHHAGVTLYEHLLPDTKKLLSFIKDFDPRIMVSIGGPMPTMFPRASLAHCRADFVFIGEAEESFKEMLRIVGADWNFRKDSAKIAALWEVEGLCLLDREGGLIANPKKPAFSSAELDSLPLNCSLVRDLIWDGIFHLTSSRGCPYHCIFCTKVHGDVFRAWSAQKTFSILLDIDRLTKEKVLPPVHTIAFHDDDFFCERERVLALVELLKSARLDFKYIFQSNIVSFFKKKGGLDRELLHALENLKIHSIRFGTESLNSKELKRLRKPYSRVEKIWELTEDLHKMGILVVHYLILSNPWTTALDFLDSIFSAAEMVFRFGCRFVINENIVPIYGSPFFEKLVAEEIPFKWKMEKVEGHPEFDYPIGIRHIIFDPLIRRTIIEVLDRRERKRSLNKDNPFIYLALFKKHLDREKKMQKKESGKVDEALLEIEAYWKRRRAVLDELWRERHG